MIGEELKEIVEEAELHMAEATSFLKKELSHIRTGKASPALIEGVKVEYYGSQTPLQQLASVSAPEARLLTISPYDKSTMEAIEKAIMSAGLGLNPNNDGDRILIPLPMLTEERRKELVKKTKEIGENARISIRNSRRNANDDIKKTADKHSLSEDAKYEAEDKIQELTDTYIDRVDELLNKKEDEIMTV
ncbi:MAG: ribosome recycling factor [Balneolaceae bacterium]|nr:ribosome recycling factor [Balneolaceae bacterium]